MSYQAVGFPFSALIVSSEKKLAALIPTIIAGAKGKMPPTKLCQVNSERSTAVSI